MSLVGPYSGKCDLCFVVAAAPCIGFAFSISRERLNQIRGRLQNFDGEVTKHRQVSNNRGKSMALNKNGGL